MKNEVDTRKVVCYAVIAICALGFGIWKENIIAVVIGCAFFIVMELRLTERDIRNDINEIKRS